MAYGSDDDGILGDIITLGFLAGVGTLGWIYKDKILALLQGGGGGGGGCTKTCGAGTHLVTSSCTCVPNSCTKTCPSGQHVNSSCQCVANTICNGKTCGAGQHLNNSTCNCDPDGTGGGAGGFTVAFVGDSDNGGPMAQQVLKQKPNAFIGLGDYGYDAPSGFTPVSGPMKNAGVPMYGTQGNHDVSDGAAFLKIFSGNPGGKWLWTKNFNANLSVTSLNTESSGSSTSQADGLLKQATGKFKVVIFHKPIHDCSSKHSPDEGKIKSVYPLFAKYGVKLVLAGHNHHYIRFKPCSGVTTCVVGTGGHSLYKCGGSDTAPCGGGRAFMNDSTKGYLQAIVSSSAMACKYITTGGQVLDSFTL